MDFVETSAAALVTLGHEPGRIRARTLQRDRRFGMTRLDGNAIAGELFDIFGEEMTAAIGSLRGLRGHASAR